MADEHVEGAVRREEVLDDEVDAEKGPVRADEPEAEGPGGAAPAEESRMPPDWSVTRAVEEPGSPEPEKVDQNAETKKWPLDPAPEPAAAEVEAPEIPSVEGPSAEGREELGAGAPESAALVTAAPKPPKKKRPRRKKPVSKTPRRPRKKAAKGRAKRSKKARA